MKTFEEDTSVASKVRGAAASNAFHPIDWTLRCLANPPHAVEAKFGQSGWWWWWACMVMGEGISRSSEARVSPGAVHPTETLNRAGQSRQPDPRYINIERHLQDLDCSTTIHFLCQQPL